MIEIPDGENVRLLDEGDNVILTSDFSSGEEWTLEEWFCSIHYIFNPFSTTKTYHLYNYKLYKC